MSDMEQGSVSPATAGGAPVPGTWRVGQKQQRNLYWTRLDGTDEFRGVMFDEGDGPVVVEALNAREPFGEPDPRDAEIERLRGLLRQVQGERDRAIVELEQVVTVAGGDVDFIAEERGKARSAVMWALGQLEQQRDEAREEWKRADLEVTRLKRLVGNEAVPDGWNGKDRQEAIVRAEESYSEWLKMRDERDRLRAELDRIREQQQAGDIAIAVLENIRPQLRTIARSIGLDGSGPDTWRDWLATNVLIERGA